MDQMKKAPNSKQKKTLDDLTAIWNPLLEETKTKHTNVKRTFDILNQLETLLKTLAMQIDENRVRLNKISGNKVNLVFP